jgi:hypothetical protein
MDSPAECSGGKSKGVFCEISRNGSAALFFSPRPIVHPGRPYIFDWSRRSIWDSAENRVRIGWDFELLGQMAILLQCNPWPRVARRKLGGSRFQSTEITDGVRGPSLFVEVSFAFSDSGSPGLRSAVKTISRARKSRDFIAGMLE